MKFPSSKKITAAVLLAALTATSVAPSVALADTASNNVENVGPGGDQPPEKPPGDQQPTPPDGEQHQRNLAKAALIPWNMIIRVNCPAL